MRKKYSETRKLWYSKNKERVKQYYLDNKDKIKERAKDFREQHPEKSSIYSKKSYQKNKENIKTRYNDNKDYYRDTQLRTKFGITLAQYNEILESQNGVCLICKKPETQKFKGGIKNLAVDHCHDSGRVRGLLCNYCNQGLGLFLEDENLLLAAAEYLKSNKSIN